MSETRGADEHAAPPNSVYAGQYMIPRTTLADVQRIADEWSERAASPLGKADADTTRQAREHWRRVCRHAEQAVTSGDPAAVYEHNNEFWRALTALAITLSAAYEVGRKLTRNAPLVARCSFIMARRGGTADPVLLARSRRTAHRSARHLHGDGAALRRRARRGRAGAAARLRPNHAARPADDQSRSGEVKALRWREDVDLIAKTITVNTQTCYGETTTPKGRTRRVVPMTVTLEKALRALETIREGYVVRNLDGSQKTDGQANAAILRICRRAGLPVKRWHTLRHTFGTHAALFGVNPWRLQSWMGHKRIDETMIYVHVAEQHRREIPPEVLEAGNAERDPDRRVLAMLSARGKLTTKSVSEPAAVDSRGSHVAVGSA